MLEQDAAKCAKFTDMFRTGSAKAAVATVSKATEEAGPSSRDTTGACTIRHGWQLCNIVCINQWSQRPVYCSDACW